MKKIYSLLLLAVALTCVPWSAKGAVTVLDEGFESNSLATNGWTKAGTSQSSSGTNSYANHTGSYGYRFSYADPSQYLISKELSVPSNASDLRIEFYYKTPGSYGPEKFKVGYSTTTNDVTGDGVFTWDTEVETSVTEWTEYTSTTNSFSIPTNVKYIAIAYTADNTYYLNVDDIKLTCKVNGPAMSVYDGESAIASGYNYSFGLATAGTTKTFTVKNDGTEATPVAVSHTGSFGAELSAASIPAGGEVTLTVTMPETTGEDVITISSTAEGIDDFVINVSGTIRDASKLYETLLGGSIPEDWTTSGGTWSWSTTNGASNTAWYETSNYRLITPQLIVAEGEKFFFEAQGTYSGYQGVKFEYSADGSTWTASATATAVTSDWQTFEINDVPAGKYYIALHGWHVNIRNFYGGTLIAKVKNVAAAGVTDTEATISWEAAGSETAWQVSYSTTSGDPNNGTIVDATSTSKVLEGLSATTTYYVSVRIGDSGEWSNEISFKTGCAALSGGWSLNFDELEVGAIPECWDNSSSTSPTYSTTPSYFWAAYQYSSASDAKMLKMNNTMIKEGTAVINTPRIELPASPAYEFDFEYSHRASCGAFIVKVSEDGGANWTDLQSYENETDGTANAPADELIEASIDLTSYAGKTIMLQFYAMADYGSGAIFVDNVAVRVKSNCALPKNVTVSSITDHTASVAWTQKGEVSAWKLQTSTDGENWGEEIEATTNPFTLSGLNAATNYYVRVKTACGESEYSDWSDASTFITRCEAKAIGWSENFDDLSALPSCWESSSYGSGNGQWYAYTNSMRFNARVSTGTSVDLVTPLVTLSDASVLTFKHEGTSVDVSVYANTGEGEVLLQMIPKSTATDSINLSAYTGQTVSFTFRAYGYGTYSSAYFYLDDVSVNYLPVAAPTNVAATPANASATVTWECEEATTYAVQYRVSGSEDTWTEVKDLTEKTYTIEGLTNGTAYEVQVKSIVSENRQSEWTASTVVTPAKCPTVTSIELSEKTFNSVKVSWTTSGVGTYTLQYGIDPSVTILENLTETEYVLTNLTPGETYTIRVLPECSTEGGQETSYNPAYTAPSNVEVKNISDVTATASWDAVADATLGYTYSIAPRGQETGIWEGAKTTNETSVELSGLAGGSDYDFYVVTNYPDDHMSSAIKIEFSTITVAPKSISVSEITASSAKLSWENDGAATAYEYALGDDPTALEWTEVAEKTKTLEGLTANTSYTFYVRAKYSDKVKSDSVNITFRTDCNAIAELPWFEGFEDMAVGSSTSAAPNCWAQLHVNDDLPYAYVNNTSSYVKTGSKSMYVVASRQTDGYLILPAFEAALNGLQISFSHKEESATKSTVLTLGYITDIANAETFVAVKEFGRATNWQEEAEISLADIPNEVAATARLAFKLGKATDQWYSGIDDITVSVLPDCQKPVLGETTILPDGASFTWTAGGDETKFQYAVDTTETLVWTATEATEATVHGLVPGKDYKFYVRAFCDPEVSDSVWTVFAPVCNAPTEAALTAATTTTASFSWTAAANISSYQYVVMAKGVAADWSKAQTTTNTTAEWTELAANTVYDFYVRSYYNETVQSAAASLSFRTACAAIAALPWSENFEDQTLNAAPACWEVVDPNNTNIYVSTGSTWFNLGTTGLFFEGANANYGYILLPEFEVALNTLQISFSHSEEHSSNSGKIELGYYKDDKFTSLKAYDQSQKTWKAEGPFALTDVPAGARLAFGYKTNSNTYAAAIDNITIEEIPACAVPTDLAASEVTATTATLSWNSEAANFKVQFKTDKADWGEEIAVAAKTLALNDLTEQTTYYARVKAICSSEDESEYSEEISFTTPCAVKAMPYAESFEDGVPACWETTGTWTTNNESEFAHSGNALRASVKNKAATLTMPAIAITEEDAELVFYVRNVYGGSSYVSGEVIVTPTAGEAKHVDVINSADINNKQKVDLSEFNGKNVVISFSISSVSSTAYVYIDDVTVAKKQCAAPTDVKVTKGDSKADVEWTAGEDETEWQVRYKASAAEGWKEVEGTIATTSYSITGLVNDTEYEVQVRAYCDETHQSAWTESVTFTPSEATGFESINGGEKAIKVMKNGVLYIIRDGVLYNAQGARVMDN